MHPSKPGTGPHLLGQRAQGEHNRILANLEHGADLDAGAPVLAPRRGRVRVGTQSALVLLLGALAWLSYHMGTAPGRGDLNRPAPATLAHAPVALAATPSVAREKVPALAPEPAPEKAAAIIEEAGLPAPTDSTRSPPTRAPAAAAPAIAAHTRPAQGSSQPGAAVRASRAQTALAARPAPSGGSGGAALQAARKVKDAVPSSPAPDSDVTLLTALVAHASRQNTPASQAEAPESRDVVLRQAAESTESLLQRCKQLGLIEGMLCRSRICSGRWDSDPACK